MRDALIIAAAAGILSGCAGSATQAVSPTPAPDASSGSVEAPARDTDLGPTMSSAGRALLDQGRSQRMAGAYPQASASLERALRIAPQQPSIWLELGWLRFDEGNFAQAEQMARKALSLAAADDSVRRQADQLIQQSRRAAGQ
ncbi:MAG: tetratricopeptide repeat protein [Gammaproteobacteria bacterium]